MTSTASPQEDKSFKSRLEHHPLAIAFLIMLTTAGITAAVVNWLNGDYTRNKYEAELATAESQYQSRIRDLEDKIRDIEAEARKDKVEARQPESIPNASPVSKPNSSSALNVSNRTNTANASAFISKARSLYEKKQYQAAINECDKALRIDPKNATARQLRDEIQNTMKILNPK